MSNQTTTPASNNTGELTAIGEALLWLHEYWWDYHEYSAAVIHYDSEYAAKSVLGEFNGTKNVELYRTVREILEKLKRRGAAEGKEGVSFAHVKSHSADRWNDVADGLARRGSGGAPCQVGRYAPTRSSSTTTGLSAKETTTPIECTKK